MGVHVKIDGIAEWDVAGLTVVEDSTPVDPSDSFGGAGSFSFTIPSGVDAKMLDGMPVELVDGLTVTRGVIVAVGLVKGDVRATCKTLLFPLVCDRDVAPHVGSVESYLTAVFALCGVTAVFDPAIAGVPVVALGWSGNVWSRVKQFCAAYEVEVAVVGADVVVRPLRTLRASRVNEVAFEWGKDGSRLAKRVESWFYPCTEVTDALIVGRRHSYGTQFLDAGEVVEYDIELDYSLSSVDQPVCVDSVAYSAGSASAYSVVDRWGKPVKAEYWSAQGGDVSVTVGADSRSVTVTITACLDIARAPYRLVGSRTVDGEKVEYPTLRVVGSGLAFERKLYSMHACTDGSATVEVGCEVDNDFITSFSQCHRLLLWAAVRYGSPTVRVNGAAELGVGAGARLFDDFAEYRVRSVSRGVSGVARYEAEFDTTLDDVDGVVGGATVDEFDAAHSESLRAFDVRPLRGLL